MTCIIEQAAHEALHEYYDDIYASLSEQEIVKFPHIHLIDAQPDLRWSMRPRLLDFLLQTQQALGLKLETLALAVSILDRYASKRVIYARHYQLVGTVSIWLAAKFSDNKERVPSARDLAFLCANAFEEHLFSEMERHMLDTLDWDVGAPTSYDFLELFLHQLIEDDAVSDAGLFQIAEIERMAKYMCLCALFDRAMIAYGSRAVAAAAVEISCAVVCGLAGEPSSVRLAESVSDCSDAMVVLVLSPPECLYTRFSNPPDPRSIPAMLHRYFSSEFVPTFAAKFAAGEYAQLDEDDCFSTASSATESPMSARLPRTPDNHSPPMSFHHSTSAGLQIAASQHYKYAWN